MLAEEFAQIFREEHRAVRDLLLDLIDAFRDRDVVRARSLLEETAAQTGPHFRYEEEALYPALVRFFGDEYVNKLLTDHDRAIATARTLTGLAAKGTLAPDDATQAVPLVRGILPHVSDCEGLSIMVERLPNEAVQSILDARMRALGEGLDLIAWADQVRRRPVNISS